jgi:menaquinone-dependent protoporphyrinogen IX oxidase
MNGGIVYKSKYGSTAQYAQWLSAELHLPMLDIDKVCAESVTLHDFFVIGSPVYIGKLMVKDWLQKHSDILQGKTIFLFIVCGTPAKETEKRNSIVKENVPPELLNQTVVFFLEGRMIRKNLSFLDGLMLKMGAFFQKDPAARKHMLTDFDGVRKENIAALLNAIRYFMKNKVQVAESFYVERIEN